MRHFYAIVFVCALCWTGCGRLPENHQAVLPSPGFDVHLYFNLFNGNPYYMVFYENKKLTRWSLLGFMDEEGNAETGNLLYAGDQELRDDPVVAGQPSIGLLGERKCNTLYVSLFSREEPGPAYSIEFRTFDDGFAFRYLFNSGDDLEARLGLEASEVSFIKSGSGWTLHSMCDTSDRQQDLRCATPVVFESASNMSIQLWKEGGPGDSLVLRRSDENEGTYAISEPVYSQWKNRSENQISSPWRIFIITNTRSNE